MCEFDCRRTEVTKRHNVIRNLLFDWLKLAVYDPEKEKHGLCINVGKHCPADVYLPIWKMDYLLLLMLVSLHHFNKNI